MFKVIAAILLAPILIYLVAFAITFTIPYFKVTDSNHPDFKPANFRFEDYFWIHGENYKEKLVKAIDTTFTKGMPKSKVDEILVRKLGCHVGEATNRPSFKEKLSKEGNRIFIYSCKPWWTGVFIKGHIVDGLHFGMRFEFDEELRVVKRV